MSVPTTAPKGGLSAGAQLGGAIAGTVISSLITSAFAKSDAKKQRAMEAELAKLSLAQQKDLEERLQDIQGELAKQEIIYKYLAVQKNNESLNKIQGKRYISYAILGGSILALAIVVLLIKNKKN
jgi:Flp pilus assembly protein TadB